MSDTILQIKNLNVEFPVFGGIFQHEVSQVHAVNNVNLDIMSGKIGDDLIFKFLKGLSNKGETAEELNHYKGHASSNLGTQVLKINGHDRFSPRYDRLWV